MPESLSNDICTSLRAYPNFVPLSGVHVEAIANAAGFFLGIWVVGVTQRQTST